MALIDRNDLVEIYGQGACSYCKKAVEVCETYKVPYQYYTVREDITLDEFKEKFPHAKTVPQIKLNGTWIGGFKELEAEFRL